MADSPFLTLYDISSPLQPRSYAPNPSKARMALSFKGVPFQTTFVDIPDIPSVRKGLSCPATRQFDNGTDFYTLPMLQVESRDGTSPPKIIGDSFDIANYLDDAFPDAGAGRLFPPDSDVKGTGLTYQSPSKDTPFFAPLTTHPDAKHARYAAFNTHVDATFSASMAAYAYNLPFNPATADQAKALFCKRAHLDSWEALRVDQGSEARRKLADGLKEALADLADLFEVNKGGPFLEGERATYADLIVGGWVNMFSVVMPQDEWREFSGGWFGGVFGRLHGALQERFFTCVE